jgi:predicted nucleic acid-binding protein
MRLQVVLDSDGLIKLAKAGILGVLVDAWKCLIPRAVYTETVERGIQLGYPDGLTIRGALHADMVRPRVRDPRATALLQGKRHLGRGEHEALHLFLASRADAIVTDDAAFVSVLDHAGLQYLPPALVLVQLTQQGHLDPEAALGGLEQMRPFIRAEVYAAARADVRCPGLSGPRRTDTGESP